MDHALYQRINEETDIVALAQEFMSLTKKGKNYMGLCPFHDEKTPSFSVSPDKHLALCFGCGKGGSPINFYAQIKNISIDDAALDLAKRLGIEVKGQTKVSNPDEHLFNLMEDASAFYQFALKNSATGESAYDYLVKRGLTNEDIEYFGIGLALNQVDALYKMLKSKNYAVSDMMLLGLVKQNEEGIYYDVFRNRVTFPIKNDQGRVVGFSARSLNPKDITKYINSTETKIFKKGELLYHFSDSLRAAVKQKYIILHEGFFDVIASYKSGLQASVATMGTALTKDQAKLLRRVSDHVVIAYDGDSAGQKATLKAIPILRNANLKISIVSFPNKLDPDDYYKKFGSESYIKLFDHLMDPYQFGYEQYKKNKDFNKADDITSFKQEMKELLLNVDPTIIDFYERKSFDDLGIQLLLKQKEFQLPIKEKPVLKQVVTKAERAIDFILTDLLKSKNNLEMIKEHIDLTQMITPLQKDLYKDLLTYYQMNPNSDMDIETFKLGYSKQSELLTKLLNTTEYKKNLLITSKSVFDGLLKQLDEYQIQVEIKTLIYKATNDIDSDKLDENLKKINRLRKEVKKQ